MSQCLSFRPSGTSLSKSLNLQSFVKLRSRSRSDEGQVKVRKVRVRSESCELKDIHIDLKTLT